MKPTIIGQPRNLPLSITPIGRKLNKPMNEVSERLLNRFLDAIDETYTKYLGNAFAAGCKGEYHSIGKLVADTWGITHYDAIFLDDFYNNQEFQTLSKIKNERKTMFEAKICSICKEPRYYSMFTKDKYTKDGYRSSCKRCDRDKRKLKSSLKKHNLTNDWE